nr:MAG TPA: hypothetical protein [Caudoviricetes sp.]
MSSNFTRYWGKCSVLYNYQGNILGIDDYGRY